MTNSILPDLEPDISAVENDLWHTDQRHGEGLDFYLEEGISPVRYDISDLDKHFQIRESLYRSLGMPPAFFKGRDVLEVAPGSGQNSLYLASRMPRSLDLVEPNVTAQQDLEAAYEDLEVRHRDPNLIRQTLEEFDTAKRYDIAICEGWLGGNRYEMSLMKKLSGFVAPGGILSITFMPPIGAIASLVRRLLAYRVISKDQPLDQQTEILIDAFGPHLATLGHLSRTPELWVQDNIINPHIYVGILTPKWIFQNLGPDFEFYGSIPRISTDWRWYKSVFGDQTLHNQRFLESFYASAHNLLDYRTEYPTRDPELNKQLEQDCLALIGPASQYDSMGSAEFKENVGPVLRSIIANIETASLQMAEALTEAISMLERDIATSEQIAGMESFAPIFGRDQCFLSMTRRLQG